MTEVVEGRAFATMTRSELLSVVLEQAAQIMSLEKKVARYRSGIGRLRTALYKAVVLLEGGDEEQE